MTLRSPISINSRQSLLDLQRTKERLAVTQREISTGKRLNSPTDDPAGAALVVDFNASIEANAQYIKQIDGALSFLQGSESAVSSVIDSLQRALELGVQGLPGNGNGTAMANIAPELDSIRSNIISLSNTVEQGKYVFAGTRTLTQPFSGPSAGPITYAGNSGIITSDVSASSTVDLNLPGDALFFGPGGQGSATDLFKQVTDLRDAMQAGNTANVQTAYTNLRAILTRLVSAQTDLGGRQAGISALKESTSSYNLVLQGILNSVQDTDLPDAITRQSNDQITQQITLNSMAKVGKTNLFDFLG